MIQTGNPAQDFAFIFDGLEGPQWKNSEQKYLQASVSLKQQLLRPPDTEQLLNVLATWDDLEQCAQTQFVYLNMLEYLQHSREISQRRTALIKTYKTLQQLYQKYLNACGPLFEKTELQSFALYYKNLRYDHLLAPLQQQYTSYRESCEQHGRGEISGPEHAQACALLLQQNAEIMRQSAQEQGLQDHLALAAELDGLAVTLIPELLQEAQSFQAQCSALLLAKSPGSKGPDPFEFVHAQSFTQQAAQRLSAEIEKMTQAIFQDRFWFFSPHVQSESRDWSNFTSRGSVGLIRFQANMEGVLRTAHEMGHCVLYDILLQSLPFVCMPQSKLLHEFAAILFEFLVFFEVQTQEKSRVLAEQRERQFWRKWIQQIYFNLDIVHFELQIARLPVAPEAQYLSDLWSQLRQASGTKSEDEWRHIPHLYGSGGRLLYCHHYALCPLLILACLEHFSGHLDDFYAGVVDFFQQAAFYPLGELFERTLGLQLNRATLKKAFQALLQRSQGVMQTWNA